METNVSGEGEKMRVLVKICGLTSVEEARMLVEENVTFGGVVLFYEKSKRYCTPGKAKEIARVLKDGGVKAVAVTVSPGPEQVRAIEEIGFDYLQIHGALGKEVLEQCKVSVIRAFNMTNMGEMEEMRENEKIAGWLFDAALPGEGKTFDWEVLKEIERDGKLFFLAGGLTAENVEEAIGRTKPNVVDVSSGVEYEDAGEIERKGYRKDREKIREFVRKVKNCD